MNCCIVFRLFFSSLCVTTLGKVIVSPVGDPNDKLIQEFYKTSFQATPWVTVVRLLEKNDQTPWELDDIVQDLSSHVMEKKITIKTRIVKFHRNISSEGPGCSSDASPKLIKTRSENRCFFKEELSFRRNSAYVIICKQPQVLLHQIHLNKVIFRPRKTNMVIFSSKNPNMTCLRHYLRLTWTKFQIPYVIALIHDSIFIYNPFEPTLCGYGQLEQYLLKDIVNDPTLLPDGVTNLKGYPLNISIFDSYPSAFYQLPKMLQDSQIYKRLPRPNGTILGGIDGVTITTLSQLMNFSMNICKHPYCNYYGMLLENKTVIGSLKMVIDRKVDIQANARYITDYHVQGFEFAGPYMSDNVCLIVPRPTVMPMWLKLALLFDFRISLFFLVVIVFVVLINKLIHKEFSTGDSLMEVFCILLGQSRKSTLHYRQQSARLLLGSLMLFSMIVSSINLATLYMYLRQKTYIAPINTLEELYKSGMQIKSDYDPFEGSTLELYQNLSKKLTLLPENRSISFEYTVSGQGAGVQRLLHTKFFTGIQYIDSEDEPLIHVVPECPRFYWLTYIVPSGSPFLKTINHYLVIFSEHGLYKKWYRDFDVALQVEAQYKIKRRPHHARNPTSMKDILYAFWLLGFGLGLASVVFFYEIFYVKLSHK
ncbi:uncharacterized protein LOC126747362 [Anthonomus grandis grandis]|uniref:uncharacterized protein LOC126747362 n=1 Tax=Anthonomus grandis grandis TaxID=2921223 RepID=UPI002165E952|nr:uncharacterized protein LOC126747362 [Anthonomus grandis grandis]